ncbi:MAG TPA: serine hydrolase [Ferruginibacter sp.]|nr:serine hydrolase [Ferruginibacter sp.]
MFCKYNSFIPFFAGLTFLYAFSTAQEGHYPDTSPATLTADTVKTGDLLEALLKQHPAYFDSILRNRRDLNVQIIYTQVNRGANGIADLKHHYFNVDAARYFYPASTVKLPVSLLALQKLNELKDKGIDRNTTLLHETSYSGQTAVYNDPTTINGKPTITQYIKKILMVSDNDAFNRLYEFLGQEYINSELHKKGYEDAQILHRLDIFLTAEENRRTNPLKFLDSDNNVLYSQGEQRNNADYIKRTDSMGLGYYKAGNLVNGKMDFSKKNRISLEDLHNILVSIVFPNKVRSNQRFNITEEDRQFVLKYMSQYPTESDYPPYSADTVNYWPAYCKFLLFGREKEPLPENIRIFNKVGDAYGHMIDVAYVVDFKNNVEFFVSAAIYCNSDGVLNDDKYDYERIGLPFMKHLGEIIYDYEIKRPYKHRPDLSSLIFKYDK